MRTTTLSVPAGFRERDKLKSRTIARAGFSNRGVIFTTSDQPSGANLSTNLLVGTQLEHINKGPDDKNRFFEILGGYFFGKDDADTYRTTQVFGICRDKNEGFEITENGTIILNDHWEIFHPKQDGLDERMNNDDGKPSEGWTLVVVPKDDFRDYPRSLDPLAIHVDCGEITGVTVDYSEQAAESQSVAVNVEMGGPTPDLFIFDWGDGSKDEQASASAVHSYERKKEQTTYTVNISCKGPGPCVDGSTASVVIPALEKICPNLDRINISIESEDNNSITIKADLDISGATPNSFTWQWGDGSPSETSNSPSNKHTYQKGEKKDYLIQVEMIGPGDCKTSGNRNYQINPFIPICPKISEVKLLSLSKGAGDTFSANLEADIVGTPTSYHWNWGDGSSPEITNTPKAKHTYQAGDKEKAYQVKFTIKGPDDCESSGTVQVVVPAKEEKEKPFICRIMPYIVAFLGALLTSSLLVCFVAEIVEAGNNGDILITTGILLVAFMASVILWLNQGKKHQCIPGACEWLAVGWVSMLAGLGTSFFLIQCITSWQILAIAFFLATAILAFFWFKNCAKTAKAQTFFSYFITGAIALLLSIYLIAVPVLACV